MSWWTTWCLQLPPQPPSCLAALALATSRFFIFCCLESTCLPYPRHSSRTRCSLDVAMCLSLPPRVASPSPCFASAAHFRAGGAVFVLSAAGSGAVRPLFPRHTSFTFLPQILFPGLQWRSEGEADVRSHHGHQQERQQSTILVFSVSLFVDRQCRCIHIITHTNTCKHCYTHHHTHKHRAHMTHINTVTHIKTHTNM